MRARRSSLSRIALLGSALAGLACGGTAQWRYEAERMLRPLHPIATAKVTVLPFEDRREGKNRNNEGLYLLPIWPVAPVSYAWIEDGRGFVIYDRYVIEPTEDLARAAVAELRASGLFASVDYAESAEGADWVLAGHLDEMRFDGRLLSYGLSLVGPVAWALGLPVGTARATLHIELELRDRNGRTVWRGSRVKGEHSVTTGFYYNNRREFDAYPTLLRRAFDHWIPQIGGFVREHPKLFAETR